MPVGVNVVTLIVKDDDQLEGTDTVTVNVQPAYDGPRSVIGVAFNTGTNNDQAATNGIYWNGMGSSSSGAVTLRDSSGNLTDVTFEYTNPFDYVASDRGVNQRVEVNGISVPAQVMKTYVATNYDNSRDGLAIAQIKSTRNYRIKVTVISSVNHNNPEDNLHVGKINSGGTWGGAFNRTFVGGESITVDAGKGPQNWDFARSNAWFQIPGNGTYQMDLGFGASGPKNGGGMTLNALILELTDITDVLPEEPQTGFPNWIANAEFGLHGADQDMEADPDRDGIKNVMEYMLRLNPAVPGNLSDIVYLHQVGNQHRFRFRFNNDATDMSYAVEYSNELSIGSWDDVPSQNIATITTEDGCTVLEATIPGDPNDPIFVRLRATLAD